MPEASDSNVDYYKLRLYVFEYYAYYGKHIFVIGQCSITTNTVRSERKWYVTMCREKLFLHIPASFNPQFGADLRGKLTCTKAI